MFRERYGGWQYKVFLQGNKVEKRPKSTLEIAETIIRSDITYLWHPKALLSKVNQTERCRENSVENIKNKPIDYSLLANVEFDGQRVIQDRVMPVRDALENADSDTSKSILDRCIKCLFECWKQGFSEESYSFAENYGILDGKVVVIDVGELCFSKKQVEEQINKEVWLDSYTYQLLSPVSQEYFRSEMARRVTVDELNRLWNIKNTVSSEK